MVRLIPLIFLTEKIYFLGLYSGIISGPGQRTANVTDSPPPSKRRAKNFLNSTSFSERVARDTFLVIARDYIQIDFRYRGLRPWPASTTSTQPTGLESDSSSISSQFSSIRRGKSGALPMKIFLIHFGIRCYRNILHNVRNNAFVKLAIVSTLV